MPFEAISPGAAEVTKGVQVPAQHGAVQGLIYAQ